MLRLTTLNAVQLAVVWVNHSSATVMFSAETLGIAAMTNKIFAHVSPLI